MKNILRSFLFMGICLFTVAGAQSAFATTETVSIDCSSNPTIVDGVDFNANAGGPDDLTLTTSGTCTLTTDETESSGDAYVSLNSLTINSGVTLSHALSGTTADHHNELDLHVTGTLTVDSGGSINVDGMGYLHGNASYTEGNLANGSRDASGGSHGGKGGKPASYALGDDYDSIKLPMLPGSGGGGTSGGDGGGVIRITATTITLNDSISANGGDITGSYTGAGAGGTIYLNATTINLASSKTISANGGASTSSNNSGGGGGGRIALDYTTFNNSGTVQAYGGNTADVGDDGAAGTVYHTHGGTEDLYIDSGTVVNDMRYDTEIDADNDETFDNVYLLNTGRLLIESDATSFVTTVLKPSTGTIFESDVDMTFAKVDTTGLYLDGGTAIFDAGLTLSDATAGFDTTSGDETGTLVTNGTTYINSGSVVIGSGLTWEANSDTIKDDVSNNLANITVKSGGTLTTTTPTSSTFYDLELTLTGTLLLETSGSISVNGKGYTNGNPGYTDGGVTTGGSRDASGGSHGGKGGKPSVSYALAEDYDSIKLPTQPGGGGGGTSGGDGGGAILITAPTITLNESLTADGNSTTSGYTGGGAGGTIYLDATTITLASNKVISANGGGSSTSNNSGGGGGGRVALYYTTLNNSGSIQAYGGNTADVGDDGAAGTIYRYSGSGDGDLYIDSGTTVDAMKYATEIDADADDTFDNVYLVNEGRLYLESDAVDFKVNGEIEIPTNTYFESNVTLPTTGGGGTYSIGSSSISLEGGIAQFYGEVTLASLDSDTNGGSGNLITNGNTYITGGSAIVGSGLIWEANSSTIKTSSGVDLVGITVKDGGTLTTSPTRPGEYAVGTQYDRVFVMDLTLSGTLLVEASGDLNVDGKGYMGAHKTHSFYEGGLYYSGTESSDSGYYYGNTKTGASAYTGGSHGGKGGQPGGYTMSEPFDSVEEPSYPGGGGGADNVDGGTGGGAVKITAAIITLNESLTADGGDITAGYAGGGAGGSIYLNATTITLASSKVISANGGNSTDNNVDGGGGGGRVAILYTTFNNSGDVQTYGGTATPALGDGAAGTVFLHDQTETYGDLYVKNCSGCSSPKYHTSLLTTVPTADQHGANNAYTFENVYVEQYGVLNIPSGLDANGTGAADGERDFFCNNCVNDGQGSVPTDGNASDGEIVYNVELFGTLPDYICVALNSLPTIVVNSILQKSDGTGYVDINFEVDDDDTADTITVKVEYDTVDNCGDGGNDPTLDSTITADSGTPTIDNGEAYQLQGIPVVDAGTNTIDFDWPSATDLSAGDGTYCLVFTPNDGSGDGTPVIYNALTVDNVAPTGLANFVVNTHDNISMLFHWDDDGFTDTNFDHYEIWYDTTQSNVTGRSGASEWDNDNDSNLATGTTNATTITGLGPNVGNYYKIWAIDEYGNESTVTDLHAYNSANYSGTPTVTANAITGFNAIIDQNSNPAGTEYLIKAMTPGAKDLYFVQTDGTVTSGEAWQTYAEWGGVSGKDITSLISNTQYDISVKARNGDGDGTGYSDTNTKYTLASPVTGVVLSNTSTDSAYSVSLAFTAGTQDVDQHGLEIDYSSVTDGSCNESYGTNNYGSTTVVPSSPRTISANGNTCYKVQIGSYNGDGELNTVDYALSNELTTPPAQPVSLATSAADETSISWNFDDVTGATSYNVYRSSDDAYIGNSATSDYTQTTITDGGAVISANTQYTVYARAVNANGTGINSSTASAYTDANAPVNASHEGASQTETVMKWTWESGGAQKEYYASMTSPSGNTGWFTSLFWTVSSGLSTNGSYGFEVKARNQEDTETAAVSANAYTAQGTPSGVTFSSVATDSITVTADGTFANLTSGSSGIRFQNTTSSADNTFQSADWTNSSLDPNTQYSYTLSAKNGDGDETSTVTSAKYTLANVPGVPTIDGNTTSTLDVAVAVNSNPAATEFLIQETGSGEYVQADGTLGAGEIWQIVGTGAGEWGNTTTTSGKVQVSGLAIDTSYEFQVKTRNGESVETAYGTAASSTTSIEDGVAPGLSEATQTTMDLLIDEGANPSSTTYLLTETSTSEFVQADGSLGDTEVWQTAVEWGTESGTDGQITITGLSASTEYTFTVTPKSSGGTEGAVSDTATLTTEAVPVVEDNGGAGSPAVFMIHSNPSRDSSDDRSDDQSEDGDESSDSDSQDEGGDDDGDDGDAGGASGDDSTFNDVDGHWAEDYVDELYEKGVVSGKTVNTFGPDDEITRAEFAKMVMFAYGYEIKEFDESSFVDLDEDHWAFNIVEAAVEASVLSGYEDGTVEADEPLTRAEALAIIFSAAGQSVYGPGIPDLDFEDVDREKWYVFHIDYAVHMGIAQGYEDGTFGPKKNVLRGEAAKLIVEAQEVLMNQ